MKKYFYLLLPFLLIISTCEKDHGPIDDGPNPYNTVNIPDLAFLNALIDNGVDTNGDSLISYAEAESVNYLDLGSNAVCQGACCMGRGSIESLKGIEAFKNLDTLYCYGNQINEIFDLSQNTSLLVQCQS